MSSTHTVHRKQSHLGWSRSVDPVLTITPGETVEFQVQDASGGQLSPDSTDEDIEALDFGLVNPTTGPIYIDGAMPGDALKVTIEHLEPCGWGWTAIIPGFGLLADEFPDPRCIIWRYDASLASPAQLGEVAAVPLKPFPGTIGVAPAEPGTHSVVPPRRVGGNMDTRDLAAGSVLWLPIEVEGGLFSVGDTHAAQGDGEVCGTAIESAMDVTLVFEVERGRAPDQPHFETPGPVTRHLDGEGYLVTMGVGPDLLEGAQRAVRGMIELLGKERDLEPEVAYMICSVAADLRISEVVDAPNWIVSCYLPKVVLR